MSTLAVATNPPEASLSAIVLSYITAGLFAVLATAQLFSYEDFPSVLGSYWLLGSTVTVHLVAALVVTTEVFALPFLLRMRASPLMRLFSLGCGIFASTMWLVLSTWALLVSNSISNGGLLGATIPLPVGVCQFIFSAALLSLTLYASYTLWPFRHPRT